MANVKISELPVATSVDVVDTVPLVQGGTTKQATQAALLTTTGNVTAAKLVPTGGTATGNGMYLPATNTLAWSTNGAEGMRLDSSGNLGVGTSSPGAKLDIGGTNNAVFFKNSGATTGYALATVSNTGSVLQYGVSSSTGTFWGSGNAGNYSVNIGTTSAVNFGFGTNDTLRMVLDSSGNLGLGVTPSAWGSGLKSLQLGNYSALTNNQGGFTWLSNNAYYDSAWKYLTTNRALYYAQDTADGGHKWYTAPSGTAGNAISFTQAMTLTSGGDLCVNRTDSEGYRVSIDGNFTTNPFRSKMVGSSTSYAGVFWNDANSGDNYFVAFVTDPTGSATTRGNITYNRAGGLVAYNTTSDYRAKDILGPVANPGATIDALKVYTGRMKGATVERPMLIAHEAQEVAPYAVTGEKDAVNEDGTPKYQQMDASTLVPLLIAEIQSLRARVAALEA